MATFYDPAKVRALAEAGDPFWKGAAWILDQQAAQAEAREEALEAGLARMAARIDTTDYDSEWTRVPAPIDREREFARSHGMPYPARLDVDPR